MQDSLKYPCAQFGYDWTKNKEMVKGEPNGHSLPPSNLFNLQKPNPCKVNKSDTQNIETLSVSN